MTLSIDTHELSDQLVVRVTGELDASSAEILYTHLAHVVAGCEIPQIIVNISGLRSIDTAGLFVLIEGSLQAQRGHGGLRLATALPPVERLLHATRLDEVLEVYPSVDEALFGTLYCQI